MMAGQDPEHYLDKQSDALKQQAECCRRLAGATYDRHTSHILQQMAEGFERTAEELEQKRKG